jgi:enamine deaminase RidA (YjgF/YER057c/UK114 family)
LLAENLRESQGEGFRFVARLVHEWESGAKRFAKPGDISASQARRCLEIIATSLESAGSSLRDVVRTRILLTRIADWIAVAMVHGEFFRDIRPVSARFGPK